MFDLLTIVTFLPLCGALALFAVRDEMFRKVGALAVSLTAFVVSLFLLVDWNPAVPGGFAREVRFDWFPEIGLAFHLGVDGVSLWLVLLTTFMMPIAVAFSNLYVTDRIGQHLILLLLMETALIGVFLALDLVLFFVFFEFTLIPMYFLIGQWGSENREYAAIKFVMYTLLGSACMLVAVVGVYVLTGTFSIPEITRALPATAGLGFQRLGFLTFAVAFAVKIPLFPFHTWLPDAHVQAPTAGSIILASLLLKMGAYGIFRLAIPFFPAAAAELLGYVVLLALAGIVYGGLVALKQRDVKSLVAYSSVAHMGFVVLGFFVFNTQGASGAVLQMVNHGLSTGALFLLVGFLYERRHTRNFADFGGLWHSIPVYCAFFLIVAMSSAGLPGLNGFVGEFSILMGTYAFNPWYALVASIGVVLAAWYLLTAYRRLAQGEIVHQENRADVLPDLNSQELSMLVPLVVMCFVIGLFPNLLLDKIVPAVELWLPQG